MDCKTAKAVWNHPAGFIAGVEEHLPGVIPFLRSLTSQFLSGTPDPFDRAVKEKVGETGEYRYFLTHAQDGDPLAERVHSVVGDGAGRKTLEAYFSTEFGQPVFFDNICCKSCKAANRPADYDLSLRIQLAAVNTDADGE